MFEHCFIDRRTGQVIKEKLLGDRLINFLYSKVRENSKRMFDLAISQNSTKLLNYFYYERKLNKTTINEYIKKLNINVEELLDDPKNFKKLSDLFERKIKYWEFRPMDESDNVIVSPSDSKILLGSLKSDSFLFIKEKFFILEDLLIKEKWINKFKDGDFAIFRLTPEDYHYNHSPVSGIVLDIYQVEGRYHSCNPISIISIITPYSLNRRTVTIIDTDVKGGSKIGLVAFIEVVAMMVGIVKQAYSEYRYDNPIDVKPGLFIKKGLPKSYYKPGSSTNIVLFQPNKICFDNDLIDFSKRHNVNSRYTIGFKKTINEIKIKVRERFAERTKRG